MCSSDLARPRVRTLLQRSLPQLPKIVETVLRQPMRAFGGRPLVALVDPQRVKPEALFGLEQQVGPALYTSSHWIRTEALRLLALTGFRAATMPEEAREISRIQEAWMLKLGDTMQLLTVASSA